MNGQTLEGGNSKLGKTTMWRRVLFAIACVVTLIALAYAEENWRGRHTWQKYRRELELKGEKLTLGELLPPPVPDDKNFALAPLLKPILDYTQGTAGVVWHDTNGRARLDRFTAALPPRDGTNLTLGSLEKGTFADVAAWREHYLRNTNSSDATASAFRSRYGLEVKGNENSDVPAASADAPPAEVVLTALSQLAPEFHKLREAAATRPFCRFPVHYQEEPPAGVLLPHLARLKGMATVLQVRATAELEAGRPSDALDDWKLALRLSDSIRDEPLIISHLVRVAILGNELQTVREGLVRHAWIDSQLAEIEAVLRPVNLLAEYKLGMRGDRAGMVAEIEYMRRHGSWGVDVAQFFGEGATTCERVIRFGPSGWAYQNMSTFSRYIQEFTLAAVDEQARRLLPDISDNGTRALQTQSGPYTLFVKLTQTGWCRVIQRTGRMQTFVDATRVACAMERYRLTNGRLPETLSTLAPQFIERIPKDVIDGQPLRWKRNADGGYVVYSIGWNKTDDGGERGWDRTDDAGVQGLLKEKAGPWVDPARGDWVWEMTK